MSDERTIIVGDVHGCIDELRDLLRPLGLGAGDRLVFVGDMVDRGPDSLAVVQYVRELKDTHRYAVEVVMGNHDYRYYKLRKKIRVALEQEKKVPDGKDEIYTINRALSRADGAFLDSWPYYIKIEDQGVLVVHGGLIPEVTFLPPMEDIRLYSNSKREKYDSLLFTRFLNPHTLKRVPYVRDRPGDIYWADVYDGRLGYAYYGHEAYLQDSPKEWEHAMGVDLGCVFGGYLAAVVLENGERRFVMVKARREYCERGAL